jgi:hypothetical protein
VAFPTEGGGVAQAIPSRETREHSSFNEIISRDSTELAYDDNGNQTDDGELAFRWDFQNRLRQVFDNNGTPLDAGDTNSGHLC